MWSAKTGRQRQPTPCLQQQSSGQRGDHQRSSPAAMHEKSRGEGNVYQQDFERQAVDSGHGGDPGERNVVDLRDAQQVPRETADARARQFDRHPEKWCGKKGQAVSGVLAREKADQQSEQSRGRARDTERRARAPEGPRARSGRRTDASCRRPSSKCRDTRARHTHNPTEILARGGRELICGIRRAAASRDRGRGEARPEAEQSRSTTERTSLGSGKLRICSAAESRTSSQACLRICRTVEG